MDLLQEVNQTIVSRQLLRDGQPVLVAVSGGLDSMVLLHVLHALSSERRWRLAVAHFNHQLRGAESDGDERFVRAAARRLDLEWVCERWKRREHRNAKKFGLEMAARLARHGFFGRAAQRLNIPTVALAHHADDQAELFFLRLFRGAGGEGLSGMKWSSDGIAPADGAAPIRLVRPLLAQRRETLRAFARTHRIWFREDSSNARLDHERNRVRRVLLPLLARKFDPSIVPTVLRAMEIAGADADCARRAAEEWLAARRRAKFLGLHPAVQRQCLRVQLDRLSVPPNFDLIERLRLFPNKPVTISPGCAVCRDDDGQIARREQAKEEFNPNQIIIGLAEPRGEREFDGVKFNWQIEETRGSFRRPKPAPGRECFNAVKVGLRIKLRHWRRGDRFQPIGMDRQVKLQDLFTNLKVPVVRRRELVVAETAQGRIFWVEGLRISEQFKLDADTRRRLKWRWHRHESA